MTEHLHHRPRLPESHVGENHRTVTDKNVHIPRAQRLKHASEEYNVMLGYSGVAIDLESTDDPLKVDCKKTFTPQGGASVDDLIIAFNRYAAHWHEPAR